MYAEFELMLPFTQGFQQGFPQEASEGDQHLPPFPPFEDMVSMSLTLEPPNLSNLLQTCAISEYDLGGDGDLFKAPKAVVEESFFALDPLVDVISMMSGYGNTITEQTLDISEMESIPDDLFKVFSNCKNDHLAKSTTGMLTSETSDSTVATAQTEEYLVEEKDKSFAEGSLQKSISFGCLSSGDCANVSTVEPCFLGVQEMNLEAAFAMRRAHSEGDIQIIGIDKSVHGNMNTCPSFKLLATIEDVKIEEKIEERRKKLSRYRKKRTKRNYGRKIKYACRKALADSQPRIRGRFAKIEDRHSKNEEAN